MEFTQSNDANPATSTSSGTSSKCSKCNNTDGELKRCAKCQTVQYCNRECQTAHWKVHKKECASLAAARNGGPSTSGGASARGGGVPKRSNVKPFTAIYHNNFLHDRAEKETFNILIDVLRMKQEDTYNFEGVSMTGTIYNGEASSIPAFRTLLRKARGVQGLLPPWWTEEKNAECVMYGAQSGHGFSLSAARQKSDIQEAWKDTQMPMKLRMLGEKIYGVGPGGQPAASMLRTMMAQEGGSSGNLYSHLDIGGFFKR